MTVNKQKAKTRLSKLSPRARKPNLRALGTERGKIWMAPDFDALPKDFLLSFYGGQLPKVEHPPTLPKPAKRLP